MIDILLASYNGEEYLSEQIESILSQSEPNWSLFICDDCSDDGSFSIASDYAMRYPAKIKAIRNPASTGSAQANFMGMLKRSKSEYIMFSDQDDVWHEDKISLTLKEMEAVENGDKTLPVLVHTDLTVSDDMNNVIAGSMMKYQGLDPECRTLNRLVVQNNVTGCTMMINRALADIVSDTPASCMVMHDWWLAMAASAFGRIGFVDRPTMMYRQHKGNQIGAFDYKNIVRLFSKFIAHITNPDRADPTFAQAGSFLEMYEDILPEECADILSLYVGMAEKNKLQRLFLRLRHGFLRQNPVGVLSQILMG